MVRSTRRLLRVTDSPSSRKSFPAANRSFTSMRKTFRRQWLPCPNCLAPLKLHYLRWVLFPINGETYFMYQGIFDTDFDKYTEDAVSLFTNLGVKTVFENLEGFPEDWQTNPEAFIKFVRDHQCPSFLEYGEYPYFSADEIKKGARGQGRSLRDAGPDAVKISSWSRKGY